MEEGRIQTIDRIIEEITKNQEAIMNFIKLIGELQRTGILPFLVGFMEKIDSNIEFLVDQNSILIKNINTIYSILNGNEEVKEVHVADIVKLINDPEVRKGLYLVLKLLKAIGSANKED